MGAYLVVGLERRAVAHDLVDRDANRKGHSPLNGLAILALAAVDESRLGVDEIITRSANVHKLGIGHAKGSHLLQGEVGNLGRLQVLGRHIAISKGRIHLGLL